MKNPFIFGGVVSGDAFCDREEELAELLRAVQNNQNVVLYSPRRFGKTSLIRRALDEVASQGILTLYLDLYPAVSKQKFLDLYAGALARSLSGSLESITGALRRLLPKLIPKVVVQAEGTPTFEFDYDRSAPITPHLDDLLEAMHVRASRAGVHAAVVFDEFQEIAAYEDDEIAGVDRPGKRRIRDPGPPLPPVDRVAVRSSLVCQDFTPQAGSSPPRCRCPFRPRPRLLQAIQTCS